MNSLDKNNSLLTACLSDLLKLELKRKNEIDLAIRYNASVNGIRQEFESINRKYDRLALDIRERFNKSL
jgi:hypothetical protein